MEILYIAVNWLFTIFDFVFTGFFVILAFSKDKDIKAGFRWACIVLALVGLRSLLLIDFAAHLPGFSMIYVDP